MVNGKWKFMSKARTARKAKVNYKYKQNLLCKTNGMVHVTGSSTSFKYR
uniref:Uncharacterized protein n=1 Tax=Anguilla anguilla TaxID=7936 RepID=A0A0E9WQI3_ANGAN